MLSMKQTSLVRILPQWWNNTEQKHQHWIQIGRTMGKEPLGQAYIVSKGTQGFTVDDKQLESDALTARRAGN